MNDSWQWGNYRGTDILHVAKIPGFGENDLFTGGGKLIPNATRKYYGPSWRYIVEMSNPPKAIGILPGGQSGFSGSHYYSDMIEEWRTGELRDLNSSSNYFGTNVGTSIFDNSSDCIRLKTAVFNPLKEKS